MGQRRTFACCVGISWF